MTHYLKPDPDCRWCKGTGKATLLDSLFGNKICGCAEVTVLDPSIFGGKKKDEKPPGTPDPVIGGKVIKPPES